MLGNGNGRHQPSSRPPNTRRPGQTAAANIHHHAQIQNQNQNQNQHQYQQNHHNQHLYPPSPGPQGHSSPRANMNPPTSAGARNRHDPQSVGANRPPPVAAAASIEQYPAYPQNHQHHAGSSAAASASARGQHLPYPQNSQDDTQDDVQELDRHETITAPKVGTLICVKGGKKSVIDLTPREYTIGRSVDCDVVLTSLECSKRHCRIFVLAEPSQQPQVEGAPTCVWMIQDLSTNGTFVNGKRIPKNQPLPLYSGDLLEIKVGNYFEFSSLHAMYPDPNEDLKDPEYPTVHDQYLLTRKLGSGTYANVYLTQELSTGRRYACKVVNKRKAGLSERRTNNKLVQEIEVIRHFNHPNIIRVHNYIETRLYLYVVMDLAQSGELFDYLAAQYGIEETKCKLIMYQIFKGLKYLHENKVVHRDIKPENILLDFSGEFPRVMLADFGLAKRRNTDGPQQMTTLCGTLNYLAPEVINPPVRAQGYDDVVDCWAAGIMLFFLLTCRHPFDDENDAALKQKILRDELKIYAPASDGGNLFDHLTPEVADLIKKLLARNPAERLTAAEALKHPWFMTSIAELKTAYRAVHESWEAHAHRAPPALTTVQPISAGELFTQSQVGPSQVSQAYQDSEEESDLATVGVSAQQPWVPAEGVNEDAMDEDAPGSLHGDGYLGMSPASASLLVGQFASSQPSQLHNAMGAFVNQYGGAGGAVFSQQHEHGYANGNLMSAPLDRQGSVIPPPGHGSSPPPAGGSSFLERQGPMSQTSGPTHPQVHANPSSSSQYSSKFAAEMSNHMSQQSQQQRYEHNGAHRLQHSSSFSESWSSHNQAPSYAHQGGFSAAGRYTGTPYPSFGATPAPAPGSNMPPVPQFNHGNQQPQPQQQQQQQQFSSGNSSNQL